MRISNCSKRSYPQKHHPYPCVSNLFPASNSNPDSNPDTTLKSLKTAILQGFMAVLGQVGNFIPKGGE